MMDMVVANVRREPTHERVGFHKARGFKGRFLVGPSGFVIEADTREIVLGVKEVTPNRISDEMGDGLRQQQFLPPEVRYKKNSNRHVYDQGEQAIPMLRRAIQEGVNAHSVAK